MFKHIIFDWSGPIKDILDSHFWVVTKMFEKVGIKGVTLEEMRENWEQPYMLFYNKYVPEWTLKDEQRIFHEVISREDCPEPCSYKGIVELIKKLKKKGVSMVVLSSDPVNTIFPEIKKFGLENVFSEVIANVHDKGEEIDELIEKNGFDPKETVFIGDTNHEIEVGKQAGVKTIAVTWGFCTEKRLRATNPDYLVYNIKELEKILL
jgi:HAD superfamily hydrolase (TIGR01509 family)